MTVGRLMDQVVVSKVVVLFLSWLNEILSPLPIGMVICIYMISRTIFKVTPITDGHG